MRILELSTADVLGGAEGTALNFYRGFRQRGHECWLGVGRKNLDDPNILRLSDYCRPSRVKTALMAWKTKLVDSGKHRPSLSKILDILISPLNWLAYQLGLEEFDYPGIYALLRSFPQQPDLIHCHNLHGGFFDLRSLSSISQSCPVVLDVRDMWLLTGHCAHAFDCRRWTTGCGRCPDLTIPHAVKRDATAFNWRRKQRIYASSTLYVSTSSQWMMDQVLQSMLTPRLNRVIPHGIDLSIFHPGDRVAARQRLNLPPDGLIVLFSARGGSQNPFKDYRTMIEALSQVSCHLEGELNFVCLGERSGTFDHASIPRGRVHLVEFQDSPKIVADYYRAANLYLHGARAESFGKAVTEALACGIPTVASAVGGIPEQIRSLAMGSCNGPDYPLEQATGILVRPGDSEDMAKAIILALTNDNIARAIAANAAGSVYRWDLQRQISDYLDWFGCVLEDAADRRIHRQIDF